MLRGLFIVHVCRGLWVIIMAHSTHATLTEARRPKMVYLVHRHHWRSTGSNGDILRLLLRGVIYLKIGQRQKTSVLPTKRALAHTCTKRKTRHQ